MMSVGSMPRLRGRSKLLLLVFAASLSLVVVTCLALATLVSIHVTDAALQSSVDADASLVRAFVAKELKPSDLVLGGVDGARRVEIETRLRDLVDPETGTLRVKVFGPDGTVLFSDVPEIAGKNFGLEDDLRQAFGGTPFADVTTGRSGEERDENALGAPMVLEEYLPIKEDLPTKTDPSVIAVFEVYRDAAKLLATVGVARRDAVMVTVTASVILAVLLYLIFRAAQRRLTRQTRELVEATRRDALTGLLNHGAVVADLAAQLESGREAGGSGLGSVGVALVDIDNFRLLNDTHGHGAGDAGLLEVARLLRAELSQDTTLGRYGPDEFLLIAPPQCSADLEPAIERLRGRLIDLSLQFGSSERLPVTVSAGLCFSPVHGDAATELLSVATVALGEAKASGGDGVRIADAPSDEMGRAERSTFDVLSGLVIAVDTKDRYTKRHSEDVARYALLIAERAGLDQDLWRTLRIAGLLHDVGKIGIPDQILRKPAALSAEEYAIVKQHVALGDAIVRDLPNLDLVRGGIRHHHERWDGQGYLDGLSGEDIPLIARILSVADAFSAMTTSRPYRKALSVKEALHRLEDAAGSQLDERFVVAFVQGIETAPNAPLPGDGRPITRIWTPEASVA